MSGDLPINDCCKVMITAGGRFCTKCGRKLSEPERARAMPEPPPPPPLPETMPCHDCGAPTPAARLMEPLYEMFPESADDSRARAAQPSLAEEARQSGKLVLPDLDLIVTRLRCCIPESRDYVREQIWQAKVESDPVLARFILIVRLAYEFAPQRGGYRKPNIVLRACAVCGCDDPGGLYLDVEAAQKQITAPWAD